MISKYEAMRQQSKMCQNKFCKIFYMINFVIFLAQPSIQWKCKYPKGYYRGSCISCPEDTLHEVHEEQWFNDECVEMCSFIKPLIFERSCVAHCPNGYIEHRSKNIRYCKNETQSSEEFCQVNQCQAPLNVCYKLRCLKACPAFTFQYDNNCVIECPSNKPYIRGKLCIETCPRNFSFVENKECVSNCSKEFYKSNKTCVKSCSENEYVHGKNCKEKCAHGFVFQINDSRLCLKSCPDDTVTISGTCQTSCSKEFPFYLNGSCVKKCPSYSKYILSSPSAYGKTLIKCLQECPKYSSMWNFVCIDACKTYEVLYKNECRITCPVSDPYRVQSDSFILNSFTFNATYQISRPIMAFSVCVSQCGDSFVKDDNQCHIDCQHSSRKMEFNNKCIGKCPPDYPLMLPISTRFKCVDNCPYVQHRGICKNYCGTYFRINNTCLDECPDGYLYELQLFQVLGVQLNEKVCVSNCSAFRIDNECVARCPHNKPFMDGIFCLKKCSDVGKFRIDNSYTCINSCPNVYYDDICLDKCPWNAMFSVNSSCEKNCLSPTPYKNILLELEDEGFNYYRGYFSCVNSCPDGKFIQEDKCVNYCNVPKPYLYNNSCYDKCPEELPYSVEYEVLNTYAWNIGLFKLFNVSSFLCSKSCKDKQFILNTTCYNRCPKGKTVLNKCVENCPPSFKWTLDNECVAECPHHMYSSEITMSCVTSCPPNSFRDGSFCLKGCSDLRPVYIKTIEYKFPKDLFYYECVRSCPVKQVFNTVNECIKEYDCEEYVYDGKCLPACPKHTFQVYENSSLSSRLFCRSLVAYYILSPIFIILVVLFGLVIFKMTLLTLQHKCKKKTTKNVIDYTRLIESRSSDVGPRTRVFRDSGNEIQV